MPATAAKASRPWTSISPRGSQTVCTGESFTEEAAGFSYTVSGMFLEAQVLDLDADEPAACSARTTARHQAGRDGDRAAVPSTQRRREPAGVTVGKSGPPASTT